MITSFPAVPLIVLLPEPLWMTVELPVGTGAVTPAIVIVTPEPITPVTRTVPPWVVETMPDVFAGKETDVVVPWSVTTTGAPSDV